MNENKSSEKGMSHAGRKSAGNESIKSEEKVGSSGAHGVRFTMPKDVPDHSCVKKLK